MILILSNDGDLSCDIVQDWLEFYNYPYIRFNAWDFLYKDVKVSLVKGKITITIDGEPLELDAIHAVWYRKYGFFRSSQMYGKMCECKKFDETHISHLSTEFNRVIEVLLFALRDRQWLTNPIHTTKSKMEVLKIASECGLDVADTYLVNTKEQVVTLRREKRIISKSVLDPIIASWGKRNMAMMYTVEVKESDEFHLPIHFMPSMLQEYIEKQYEFRVFYINDKMFSMAIFSQQDKQTRLDFRNYNWDKPNHMVPCDLDVDTKRKIRKLMHRLKLNCGSIDLIKSTNGNIYFLEVNPTGQFGMVDFPCNYGLHKIVAEELIKMDMK